MSSHRKNLNLQEDTGETFNIVLDNNKTVFKNSTGPIEIETTKLVVKNTDGSELVDVVSTINQNTTDISTEISVRSSAIDSETSSRLSAIASETADRAAAIAAEETSRTHAISTESADRAAAIAVVIDTIADANTTTSDTTDELSVQIVIAQNNISGILHGSSLNLNSFNEIVTAYESADTGLQEFINGLTARLGAVESIISTLTDEPGTDGGTGEGTGGGTGEGTGEGTGGGTGEGTGEATVVFTNDDQARVYAVSLAPDGDASPLAAKLYELASKWSVFRTITDVTDEIASEAVHVMLQQGLQYSAEITSSEQKVQMKRIELADWAAIDVMLRHLENTTIEEYNTTILDPYQANAKTNSEQWPVGASPDTIFTFASFAHREYFHWVLNDGVMDRSIYYFG